MSKVIPENNQLGSFHALFPQFVWNNAYNCCIHKIIFSYYSNFLCISEEFLKLNRK